MAFVLAVLVSSSKPAYFMPIRSFLMSLAKASALCRRSYVVVVLAAKRKDRLSAKATPSSRKAGLAE